MHTSAKYPAILAMKRYNPRLPAFFGADEGGVNTNDPLVF